MGRRALIMVKEIQAIKSAIRAKEKDQEYRDLLAAQNSNLKDTKPTVMLQNVEFVPSTRVAKLTFEQKQNYRTIVRYITKNYVKYPILFVMES